MTCLVIHLQNLGNRAGKYIVSGILGLFVMVAFLFNMWEPAELSLYDGWFKLRGKESPGNRIAIIAMDEKSIAELGPPPWSREIFANLLEKLPEARVVGFDLIFDAPSNEKADAGFAEAVSRHGRVVLGSMFAFEKDPGGETVQVLRMPIEQFLEGVNGIGFVNMPADKGNIVRRTTVIDTNTFSRPYPSFGLAVVLSADGLNPNDLSLSGDILKAGNYSVPLGGDYQTLINFWGPGKTFESYSCIDVLSGKIKPESFKDKIVLVGIDTPAEKNDYFENPFTKNNLVLTAALPSPGVEIHANAIMTYLTGRHFHRAGWPVNVILLLVVWLATVAASRRSPWVGLASVILLAGALLAAVFLIWLKLHYWVNAVSPLVMVAVTYLGVTVENFLRVELERRQTKALFGRYVSPAVVEDLLRKGDRIELGGVKQEVTVLFSDIRGFTAFSEGKPPEAIVARLNEYFTAMTEIVFRRQGTLDKYLGDGLMAIFGAPAPVSNHAAQAVAAAVEMLDRLEELNKRWQEKGEVNIGIGVGINSGSVVVGNIGSPERMDYTVIGEEVNLASRLESSNKEFKTRIIISENTVRAVRPGEIPAGWKIKDLGDTQVRGLVERVKIYTLIKENAL